MSVTEKTALVTGAARGIGLAIARRLAAGGARGALLGLDPGAGGTAARAGGGGGRRATPPLVPYSSAKAGVIGLTKALAKEVATRGILVHAVAPAVIGTELLKQMEKSTVDLLISQLPMGRVGRPEGAAAPGAR